MVGGGVRAADTSGHQVELVVHLPRHATAVNGIQWLAVGWRVPYVRTVRTSSSATVVQIVYSSHRGSRQIERLGSAHTAAEVELLKAAARQKLAAGQGELSWAWIRAHRAGRC